MKLKSGTAVLLTLIAVATSYGQPAPATGPMPQPIMMLRLAAQEASKSPMAYYRLQAIAEAQGAAKDIDGIKTTLTLAEIAANAFAESLAVDDPKKRTKDQIRAGLASNMHIAFARAFAFAADLDSYRLHLALISETATRGSLPTAYAAAGDYKAVDKLIDALPVGAQLPACVAAATGLAAHDVTETRALIKKAEALLEATDRTSSTTEMQERNIVMIYAQMGDVQATLDRAAAVKGHNFIDIYEVLEDYFVGVSDLKAARLVHEKRLVIAGEDPGLKTHVLFVENFHDSDLKAARALIPVLMAEVDAMHKAPGNDSKPYSYGNVVHWAARIGDEATVDKCIAAYTAAAESSSDGRNRELYISNYVDELRPYRACWLASQGKLDSALAEAEKYNKHAGNEFAFRFMIEDADARGDLTTAVTVLEKLTDKYRQATLVQNVASLVANAEINNSKSAKPVDVMKWVLSLPTPDDRAVAALAVVAAVQRQAAAK